MSRIGARRSTWLIITVVTTMLAWTVALPAVASSPNSFSSLPCPSTPLNVKLGITTPVLLVHGFNEDRSVFTNGSPSLADAIKTAAGGDVMSVTFDYHMANTDWVTDPAIGPQLAKCIMWLAHISDTQGGPGKVIIVAHSMGGLAVRCAVDPECVRGAGKAPAADPSLVGLVITLGTPNLGSNPQTAGAVGDTICGYIPACNALLQLRKSPAAEAMVPDSNDLRALPLLPIAIPVDAIAGKVTFTTDLFGSSLNLISGGLGGLGDDGDLVVPTASALADASSGKLHAGPGSGSITINCGSIPIDQLGIWGPVSLALKAPAPPVTCWHLTETTNSTWQNGITAAINSAAQALSLRACTPAAISVALAAKDPLNGAPRTLVAHDCESGWAIAKVRQPQTDTGIAILRHTATGWTSEGIGDGTCLNPGVCPGYALPPSVILRLLLQKAGISVTTTQAVLYIDTAFTPGALYKYPTGPSNIGIDNHDYIDGLQWAAGSRGDLVGTGKLHYDDCNPDCASGTIGTAPIQITASHPQQCSVKLYPNGLGNPSQTVSATVFNRLDIRALQGDPPSFLVGGSALSAPCT